MHCSVHPESEAVAQCKKCGAGVCHECAEATRNNGGVVLCLDCYRECLMSYRGDLSQDMQKTKKHRIGVFVSLGIGVFFMFAALMAALTGAGEFYLILAGYAIVGIYPAISGWNYGTKLHEEEEAKNGVTYYYDSSSDSIKRDTGSLTKFIWAILSMVFSVFVVPYHIIKDTNTLRYEANEMEEIDSEIEKIAGMRVKA